jgi:hypothetical protein
MTYSLLGSKVDTRDTKKFWRREWKSLAGRQASVSCTASVACVRSSPSSWIVGGKESSMPTKKGPQVSENNLSKLDRYPVLVLLL